MEFKGTPGPWRWELNESAKSVNLCGGGGVPFDLTVMDFERYGMNGAAPCFMGNLFLERAEKFSRVVKGREHHQKWFKGINHPDALLIEKAPEMLDMLIDIYSKFEKDGHLLNVSPTKIKELIKSATEVPND